MFLARLALVLVLIHVGSAQGISGDAAAIRSVLKDIEEGTNQRDAGLILRHATEDVVMVSKNGEIVRGRAAVAAYIDKMLGMVPSLKALRSKVSAEEPFLVYGATAIVTGTSDDEYSFSDGMHFSITTTWSASLVQLQGQWKIARIHFSFNLFDNPLLNGARVVFYVVLIAAFLLGIGMGAIWLRITKAGPREVSRGD